jgi:ankyrin repeat protein
MTPLHQAGRYGHRALVERLLAAGADPAVKDDRGRTAADYAHEHPAIAALLAPPVATADGGG